jgi:predicted site-specific integrase-resolvase
MLNQPVIYPEDELVSLPQAARILGVAPMTARVWVLSGRIPAKDAGSGRIVVRKADLDAFTATR